jgi:hypothetical protein
MLSFGGCSLTTNAYSETGQMAVCCQNLTLSVLSSCSVLSMLVGALFKQFGFFFNTPHRLLNFVWWYLILMEPSDTWNFKVASSFMEDLWAPGLGYGSQNQGIVV